MKVLTALVSTPLSTMCAQWAASQTLLLHTLHVLPVLPTGVAPVPAPPCPALIPYGTFLEEHLVGEFHGPTSSGGKSTSMHSYTRPAAPQFA